MTAKPATTAHAATISRQLATTTALTDKGIRRNPHTGYQVSQTAPGEVAVTWEGTDATALDDIATALEQRGYDVERTSQHRGAQSTYHVPMLRVTPGTPLRPVKGIPVTREHLTAPAYGYADTWGGTSRPLTHQTPAEVWEAVERVRAEHGEVMINNGGTITLYAGKTRDEVGVIMVVTDTPTLERFRTEHERSAAHWADQERRETAEAERHRRALAERPGDDRAHHWTTVATKAEKSAADCAKTVATHRAAADALTAIMTTTAVAVDMVERGKGLVTSANFGGCVITEDGKWYAEEGTAGCVVGTAQTTKDDAVRVLAAYYGVTGPIVLTVVEEWRKGWPETTRTLPAPIPLPYDQTDAAQHAA